MRPPPFDDPPDALDRMWEDLASTRVVVETRRHADKLGKGYPVETQVGTQEELWDVAFDWSLARGYRSAALAHATTWKRVGLCVSSGTSTATGDRFLTCRLPSFATLEAVVLETPERETLLAQDGRVIAHAFDAHGITTIVDTQAGTTVGSISADDGARRGTLDRFMPSFVEHTMRETMSAVCWAIGRLVGRRGDRPPLRDTVLRSGDGTRPDVEPALLFLLGLLYRFERHGHAFDERFPDTGGGGDGGD